MRGLWRRLHLHRPARQPSGLFLVSQRDDVFRNGTPVSNPWFVQFLLNVFIYLMAMMTGYAIADWINDDE